MDEIPDFFNIIFSQDLLAMIATIIAATKVLRNALGNIKGTSAIVLTFIISIFASEFTYLQELGWMLAGFVGILAGGVAAGLFKTTKLLGKNVVKLNKV